MSSEEIDDNNKSEEPLIKYFDLAAAARELSIDVKCGSNQEKIKSGAKLIGKTAFNVGLLAAKAGIYVAKNAPSAIAKNLEKKIESGELNDQQRSRAEEYINHVKSKK